MKISYAVNNMDNIAVDKREFCYYNLKCIDTYISDGSV